MEKKISVTEIARQYLQDEGAEIKLELSIRRFIISAKEMEAFEDFVSAQLDNIIPQKHEISTEIFEKLVNMIEIEMEKYIVQTIRGETHEDVLLEITVVPIEEEPLYEMLARSKFNKEWGELSVEEAAAIRELSDAESKVNNLIG